MKHQIALLIAIIFISSPAFAQIKQGAIKPVSVSIPLASKETTNITAYEIPQIKTFDKADGSGKIDVVVSKVRVTKAQLQQAITSAQRQIEDAQKQLADAEAKLAEIEKMEAK